MTGHRKLAEPAHGPAVELRLALARDITLASVLRIGYTDYPVLSLYVTRSGARVVQLAGERPLVLLACSDRSCSRPATAPSTRRGRCSPVLTAPSRHTSGRPLTSANVLPLVAANGPEPTPAVTSREHRRASSTFGAVEEGEHSRSLLTNETRPPTIPDPTYVRAA